MIRVSTLIVRSIILGVFFLGAKGRLPNISFASLKQTGCSEEMFGGCGELELISLSTTSIIKHHHHQQSSPPPSS